MIGRATRQLGWRLGSVEILLLGVVCFALRAVSLARSCVSDDEAIYAVVAREMLSGRVLYRDVVDHKPPLIYAVYALTQAIGGPRGGMLLLHLLTIAVVLTTALLLGRIVRDFAGASLDARAPLFAALLYIVFTTTLLPFDSLAANCELFMMLPLTGSVLLFLRGAAGPRLLTLAGAGALVAVAMFFKYQGGIQLALYAGTLVVMQRRRIGHALLACLVMAGGLALVLGLGAAILHLTGSLADAWFWFRFNLSYIKTGFQPVDTVTRAAVRVSFVAASAAFLWILGFGAALKSAWRHGKDRSDLVRFAAVWLAVSALATSTGGRFFGHYFHQMTAPLAVLAAPAAAKLWRSRRRLVLAGLGLPAAVFLFIGIFHDQVMAAAGQPEPDYQLLSRFIDTHARPQDSLLVWGNLPVLYFTAERPLGTRFVFSNYMTGLSPATPSQTDPRVDASPNIVPESWDMFERDVAARKPRILLDTSPGNIGDYGKFPPAHFPRLRDILGRDYDPVGDVAGARIFVRRDLPLTQAKRP